MWPEGTTCTTQFSVVVDVCVCPLLTYGLARQTDKMAMCWGMRSGVTAVPTSVQFDELTLGWNHGCGIRFEDGRVQCWGDRASNRLAVPADLA